MPKYLSVAYLCLKMSTWLRTLVKKQKSAASDIDKTSPTSHTAWQNLEIGIARNISEQVYKQTAVEQQVLVSMAGELKLTCDRFYRKMLNPESWHNYEHRTTGRQLTDSAKKMGKICRRMISEVDSQIHKIPPLIGVSKDFNMVCKEVRERFINERWKHIRDLICDTFDKSMNELPEDEDGEIENCDFTEETAEAIKVYYDDWWPTPTKIRNAQKLMCDIEMGIFHDIDPFPSF